MADTTRSSSGKLPNLIIAGVHKAGTTSLYYYLGRHPDICPSRTKELQFFSNITNNGAATDADELARHFHHAGAEAYRMYASPDYLCARGPIAELIRATLPGVRIIVILRDPVDRLLSMYSRAIAHSELPASLTFDDFVDASLRWKPGDNAHYVFTRGLRDGFYIEYLRTWKAVFGDHLEVLFFDHLKEDPRGVTAAACRWLDLDTECLAAHSFGIENRTLQYKHKRLHRRVTLLYAATERFWRKHHRLKGWLRSMYNQLNSGTVTNVATDKAIARLHAVYAAANSELLDFLAPQDPPAWLLDSRTAAVHTEAGESQGHAPGEIFRPAKMAAVASAGRGGVSLRGE